MKLYNKHHNTLCDLQDSLRAPVAHPINEADMIRLHNVSLEICRLLGSFFADASIAAQIPEVYPDDRLDQGEKDPRVCSPFTAARCVELDLIYVRAMMVRVVEAGWRKDDFEEDLARIDGVFERARARRAAHKQVRELGESPSVVARRKR
jgi:hypothetical protein